MNLGLGGLLVLIGLALLVAGYVIPVALLVTLGWIAVVVGVILLIVNAASGGRRRSRL